MKSIFILIITILYSKLYCQNKHLFRLVTPQESKINFNNYIKDTKKNNILIYSNYYGGAGVGIVDINNDGLLDIYFAGNLVNDRLYLNKGNLVFEDISKKAGIYDSGWSSGVTFVDINNDGFMDIYVSKELYDDDPKLRENKLYINNGDLTFKQMAERYNINDNNRTRHSAFFDYDKDGDLDLILLNQPPNPGYYSSYYQSDEAKLLEDRFSIRLYERRGDKFLDVTKKANILKAGFPNAIIIADFNQDDWPDMYIANDFKVSDFFYINQKNGTFKNIIKKATNHISYFSMGVDAADINNDGLIDISVVDMAAESNSRLKANMSGMNVKQFWENVSKGNHFQYMYNSLQINRGNDIYSNIAQISGTHSTDWSWANLIADFDNDGLKDIFISNGLLRDIRNVDASKKVTKTVLKDINDFIKNNPNLGDVSVFDVIDLDKILNIIPSEKIKNYIYKNNGDLTFTNMAQEWGLSQRSFSNGAAYGDLDNDGDLDIVVNNINDTAFLYENLSNEINKNNFLRIQLTSKNNPKNFFGSKAKIYYDDNIQFQELTNVRGMYSNSENIFHFGLDNYQTIDSVIIKWNSGYTSKLSNIKTNQTILLYPDKTDNNNHNIKTTLKTNLIFKKSNIKGLKFKHKENDFDDFKYQVLLPHKLSTIGPKLAVGDINNDNLDDVFIGGAHGQSGKLFIQQKNKSFIQYKGPWEDDKWREDISVCFIDFNNDGYLDIYVSSGGNEYEKNDAFYQDRLYINKKNNFVKAKNIIPNLKINTYKVIAFDFDDDGDDDIFLGGGFIPRDYPNHEKSFILENTNGKFKIKHQFDNIGAVMDAVALDINNDNKKDIITVGHWHPIRFFINKDGNFVEETKSYNINSEIGWYNSITADDIDNDGYIDLVVGNLGKNYKYKASKKHTFDIHYFDFDNNNKKDIVLSYYNFGKKFPLRGLSCSASQIPLLKNKFPSYDIFSESPLEKVYDKNKLNKSLHYKANNFENIILKNMGGKKFKIIPLNNMAQLSCINKSLIYDFDKDGHKDILIAGNMYHSEIETPRNDASIGLLLSGKNNFQAISSLESNFIASGNVKDMATIRIGADLFVIVAKNDGYIDIFKLQ